MTPPKTAQRQSSFDAHRTRLKELPPSAKLVAKVLDRNPELAQGEIVEETLLPERTVRYALNKLDEADVVQSETDLSDPRREIYWLRPAA